MTKIQTHSQATLERLGFSDFLPGQSEAISALLEGHDVITVLPTGGGKSLIYQAAGEVLPGLTVIVSPLIALMKDQVASLKALGLSAVMINSHRKQAAIDTDLERIANGQIGFLFVTPERLQNEAFMQWLKTQQIALLVLDEAHCISEWGHDFRPAYLQISEAIDMLQKPKILALTATATHYVVRDIEARLHMEHPKLIVHGIDRPNLFFAVERVLEQKQKLVLLETFLRGEFAHYDAPVASQINNTAKASGIIYTATTKTARQLAEFLNERGISAAYYHGQRKKDERGVVQNSFMSGETRVMVATNAFGMGINKQDIRFIIHYDVPGSLEAYYQEAGRAGRDGEFGFCLLLYRQEDIGRAAFLSASSGEQSHKEYKYGRLNMIQRYAELHDCRRTFILNYFSEMYDAAHCNMCDNDLDYVHGSQIVGHKPVAVKSRFIQGDVVVHTAWGR